MFQPQRPKAGVPSPRSFTLSSRERAAALAGWLGLIVLAVCFGLLASHGYATVLIVAVLLCGLATWAAARPAAVPVILLGVVLIPAPAFAAGATSIPVETALAAVTVCAATALWWNRKARGHPVHLSSYAVASMVIIIVASIAQLGASKYAELRPIYQLVPFWISGLLLGSILASDRRIADRIGLLAAPVAVLAIVESAIGKPNVWSDLIGADGYDRASALEGGDRAVSTFGHPLVAGTALVIFAFLVLARPGPRQNAVFAVIIAGALVTVSRSALVGLGAGALTYFMGAQRQRAQIIQAIGLTAVIGWLVIAQVPAFHASFESRVLGASLQSEAIRLNSLTDLKASLARGDQELWLGRGLGGSILYLGETGGNLGFSTYDNQYVTSFYDSGVLVVLAAIGFIVFGVVRRRPRAALVAPLVASAATMFFFEGLYWPATGLLFWMTVGLATTAAVGAQTMSDGV